MSDIICVTSRKLCSEAFLERVSAIASAAPAGIILREKDLTEKEYTALAKNVMDICRRYDVPCILHFYTNAAIELSSKHFHAPLHVLKSMSPPHRTRFKSLGASCHSIEEARDAESLGCTYITAGHVFDTRCKEGVPGRGLGFLSKICRSVSIPVYAIGGINRSNISAVFSAGANGACIMSGFMQCENVHAYIKELTNEI